MERRPPYTIKIDLHLWPAHDRSADAGLVPINQADSVQARIVPIRVEPGTKRVVGYR